MSTIDEAIVCAQHLDEPSRLATLLLRRAGACAYLADGDGARQAGHRALAAYREIGDRPGEAEALRELGFVHWRARDYAAALCCSMQALALHRSLGDVAGEASALHNLAEIQRGLGSPARALALYGDALQLHWAARNHQGEVVTRFGMASALLQSGDVPRSRRQYEAALALSERHGERTMQARALHALAMLERAAGALDDALRFMERALEIDRAINYAHALSHDLVDLSVIHLLRGERSEARAALLEALAWCDYTDDELARASILARLDDFDAGRAPRPDAEDRSAWVMSHLPLAEGKVYCAFESPLAD
jgi:tetratricopeptide (TPR) repeat protein